MPLTLMTMRKLPLRRLSEAEIRDRLYGGTSGSNTRKNTGGQERPDIMKELKSLKRELEQTKKRLKKAQSLRPHRLRLFVPAIIISLMLTAFSLFVLRRLFLRNSKAPTLSPSTLVPGRSHMRYAIQVVVYGSVVDARRFAATLTAKGYDAFIKESYYSSGNKKYIVYVGRFQNRQGASRVLHNLRTKEDMRDSFIVTVPR